MKRVKSWKQRRIMNNDAMSFLQVAAEQPGVQPDILVSIGSLNITNAMLMGVFVTLILLVGSLIIKYRAALMPSRFQMLVEMAVESFLGLLEQITGDRKTADQLLPLIGTLFLFIGFSNIIGLIPGLTSLTYNGTAIFRTPTNDFNMTFSIATAMIILTNVMSIKVFGPIGYLGKFFKFKDVYLGFKKSIGDGVLAIVDFLIGLLDIVSEVAKIVSLSLRLFGNMYAGEVLAAILLGAFAAVIPAAWLAMNLLVGILQALVFGALTAAYYQLAVEVAEEKAN